VASAVSVPPNGIFAFQETVASNTSDMYPATNNKYYNASDYESLSAVSGANGVIWFTKFNVPVSISTSGNISSLISTGMSVEPNFDLTSHTYHKYTFNGNTSDTGTGTARNLTNNGAAPYVAGFLGTPASANAISLDGATQYLSYADNADFEPGTGDFTVCVWYYLSGAADSLGITKSTYGDTNNKFVAWFRGSGNIEDAMLLMGTSGLVKRPSSIPNLYGKWFFFWWRRNSSLVTAGISKAEDLLFSTTPLWSFTNSESVGVNSSGFILGLYNGNYWSAVLDQTLFCKGYAFSDAELRGLYNRGIGTENMSASNSQNGGIISIYSNTDSKNIILAGRNIS
jgi:hypothetical protein